MDVRISICKVLYGTSIYLVWYRTYDFFLIFFQIQKHQERMYVRTYVRYRFKLMFLKIAELSACMHSIVPDTRQFLLSSDLLCEGLKSSNVPYSKFQVNCLLEFLVCICKKNMLKNCDMDWHDRLVCSGDLYLSVSIFHHGDTGSFPGSGL